MESEGKGGEEGKRREKENEERKWMEGKTKTPPKLIYGHGLAPFLQDEMNIMFHSIEEFHLLASLCVCVETAELAKRTQFPHQ